MPWGPGHLIEAFRPRREKQQMSSELGMSVITRKTLRFHASGFSDFAHEFTGPSQPTPWSGDGGLLCY